MLKDLDTTRLSYQLKHVSVKREKEINHRGKIEKIFALQYQKTGNMARIQTKLQNVSTVLRALIVVLFQQDLP